MMGEMEIPDELIDQLLAEYTGPEQLTGSDGLINQLRKRLIERAAGAELEQHLGYRQGAEAPDGQPNRRNGSTSKTLRTVDGPVTVELQGGSETGPSPVDRARNGSKHHLLVDATGIPLAWTLTGGNRNDVTQLIPLVERVPPVRGKVGRPRRRPERVTADRGYDHDKYRRQLWQRGIKPEIARRQTGHGSGLGRARWVVERTFAWLHHFKRLLVRYDRRHEIHEAFLALACCLVCSGGSSAQCDSSS